MKLIKPKVGGRTFHDNKPQVPFIFPLLQAPLGPTVPAMDAKQNPTPASSG